jgi:hypothetical protein
MYDLERDPQVTRLLRDAADEVSGFIRPEGAEAAVSTVRRRRRVRVAGLAVVVLALVSAPVAVVNLSGTPQRHVPPGGGSSVSAQPTPSESPPASQPPSPTGTPSAPHGGISSAVLRNATLDLPAWPKGFDEGCPTGPVKFVDGQAAPLLALQGEPVNVDVNHDGVLETIQLISCSPQGSDYQVLAFDQDANGHIGTLGKVVGSAGNLGRNGADIMTIWKIAAGDNGQVRVDVGEYRPCCAAAQASQHQWRTYGWDGRMFTQTGGPTAFGPNPKVADLVITAGRLAMTRQADGSWHGNLRAAIHNAAGYPTPGPVQFFISVDAGWQVNPATDSGCHVTPGEQPLECLLPVLPAGADRVVNLQVTAPAGASGGHCTLNALAVDANSHAGYPDRKGDNEVSAEIVFN